MNIGLLPILCSTFSPFHNSMYTLQWYFPSCFKRLHQQCTYKIPLPSQEITIFLVTAKAPATVRKVADCTNFRFNPPFFFSFCSTTGAGGSGVGSGVGGSGSFVSTGVTGAGLGAGFVGSGLGAGLGAGNLFSKISFLAFSISLFMDGAGVGGLDAAGLGAGGLGAGGSGAGGSGAGGAGFFFLKNLGLGAGAGGSGLGSGAGEGVLSEPKKSFCASVRS